MPSTFVHGFLPASCLIASKGQVPKLTPKKWFLLFSIAFVSGNLPDLDLILGLLWNEHWHFFHRNFGHNIFALLGWTALTRFLFVRFVSPEFKGRRGWLISLSLVGSHILLDSLGGALPGEPRKGVPLFFPFSTWEFLMPFEPFVPYELGDHSNPLIAHIISVQFWKRAFLAEIAVSITLFGMWCVSYYSGRLLLRFRKQPPEPVPSESNVA